MSHTVQVQEEPPLETMIHLVHGTWGRGWVEHFKETLRLSSVTKPFEFLFGEQRSIPWHEDGSQFRESLSDLLRERGMSDRFRIERFNWSGSNSFSARARASEEFIDHLEDQIERYPQARHMIVAHSHGGTVAVAALTRLQQLRANKTLSLLDGLVTLATPFVSLTPAAEDDKHGSVNFFIFLTVILAQIMAIDNMNNAHSLRAWISAMGLCILIGAAARLDFKPKSSSVLSMVGSVAAFFIFTVSFIRLVHSASFGPWELLVSMVGNVEMDNEALIAANIAMGMLLIALLAGGSILLGGLALTIGRQSEGRFRGILRQFYLTVPCLTFIPTIGYTFFFAAESPDSVLILLLAPVLALLGLGYLGSAYNIINQLSSFASPLVEWRTPPVLSVPLLALRAPRDEATLSIVFAQAAGFLGAKTGAIMYLPLRILWSRIGMVVIVIATFMYYLARSEFSWYWTLILSALFGCIYLLILSVIYIVFAAFLYVVIIFLSQVVLALAVGWEIFFIQFFGNVDCEPLPRVEGGGRFLHMVIDWSVADVVKGGLRHAIYDYPSAREIVANFIVEPVIAQRPAAE